jgi:NAD(P)-dependent dehydrogenase (short-subunit alcohol dehydrogenase family)
VALDLRDETSCAQFTTATRERFEKIDVLFISAGTAPLHRFRETSTADWLQAIETNVIGIHRVIASLVDLLVPGSLTVVVSSESVEAPRSHLGAYGASKAALEHMAGQWREEHPWLRFSVVSLGATEFASGFDTDTLMEAIDAWGGAGRNQAAFMSTPEVSELLSGTIALLLDAPSIDMPRVVLRSPSPPAATVETATAAR